MMNRQQFVAELRQYLTFVTPEQRNEVIAYYSDRLDQVGPNGEAEALASFGTPMSVAIRLKRRLEASKLLIPNAEPDQNAEDTPELVKYEQVPVEAVPEVPSSEVSSNETPSNEALSNEALSNEAPSIEAPSNETSSIASSNNEAPIEEAHVPVSDEPIASPMETTVEPEETVEEAPEAMVNEEVSEIVSSQLPEDFAANAVEEFPQEAIAEDVPDEIPDPAPLKEPEPIIEHTTAPISDTPVAPAKKPMTFGRVMGAIGIGLASIIIFALSICIASAGGLLGESGVEIIISGIGTNGYLSDALMILSAGAVFLAAGILIVWFAVWAAIALIAAMVRGFNGTKAPEKSKLKTIWNVILITIAVLLCAGIICGVSSIVMGGNIAKLNEDPAYMRLLSRLDPVNIIGFIESFGIIIK